MKLKFILIGFIIILVSGCSSISQEDAESVAVNFIDQNVKFFTREDDSTHDLPSYTIDNIQSYKEGSSWVVAMHVIGTIGNETKKRDLTVKVDRKGRVEEFDGRKVPI